MQQTTHIYLIEYYKEQSQYIYIIICYVDTYVTENNLA